MRLPRRRNSLRHPRHEYRTTAAYHVTICITRRGRALSSVRAGGVALTDLGRLVVDELHRTFERRPYALLETYVIMPNHVHLLIRFAEDQSAGSAWVRRLPRGPQARSLSALIGAFKSASSKVIRRAFPELRGAVWQRGFHDRIIHDTRAFEIVVRYIAKNPERWRSSRSNTGP